MDELIDEQDFSTLLKAILRQAIDDYIKLMHPKYRRKKYLQEAFLNAVDMFFDKEYIMLNFENEEGLDMSLRDFLEAILDTKRPDIKKLQDHVVKSAAEFWKEKHMNVLNIPDTLMVSGYVFKVFHQQLCHHVQVG